MIRLMGILTGSAIAVGLLILTVGVPGLEARRGETALQAGRDSQSEPPLPVDAAEIPEPDRDVDTVVAVSPEEPTVITPDASSGPVPEPPTEPVAAMEPTSTAEGRQWYAFWSPFRSKLAADGFVSQLQRTTGLDYRVVKLKPGVFEVAFAYSDDNDIQDKLTQISTATGLDLTDG